MTTAEHPDANIIAMISSWAELSAATLVLDERAIKLGRAGTLTEAAEAWRRYEAVCSEVSELEWRIIRTEAATRDGHAAKATFIANGDFETHYRWAEIAAVLSHEAGRLGLGVMPSLISG